MNQPARALIAVLLAMLSVAAALSESPAASATLLTVRLFSVREVQKITIASHNGAGWMRTCIECPKQPVEKVIQLENGKDGIQLASGNTVKRIELSGSFTINASGSDQGVNAIGSWTITSSPGGLRVLLSLPSENYIIAALNGEASPGESLESLKAMAVSVRTFALLNNSRHVAEGFSLCDSTHCQALRFGKPRPEVELAVKETAGETLWSGSHRAHIYFTQHCGGVTEAALNVWPREQAAYLSSHQDPYCLRRSSAAWSAQVSLDQLSKIFQQEGWHTPVSLNDVRILKRTSSGRVSLLEVSGPGTRAPISASSFRFAVDRALGWNQLRSNWYSVEVAQGVLHVEGKGYGHGVGLCQAGASEMAAEGHDYHQILNFYFPGTVTRVAANDRGWKSFQGTGLTLFYVTPGDSLLAKANRAWARANSTFPVSVSLHPKVYALPASELFRQTTGEPGWVLASTRGSDVYLQPSAILEKNGGSDKVLLHEFLHVLVEHEATSQVPLWLREGLVERLAEGEGYPKHEAVPKMSITEIEAPLAHPSDPVAAQHAHIVAGQMADKLLKRYGITTVRGWLRDGVPANILVSP
ncbi:MAG TPA: SpoIID/LytB domain-containing protein [Edaphobacter sp.]|nr:SpoIID/LytB domain-containing protein [Edaphobacter sp.]